MVIANLMGARLEGLFVTVGEQFGTGDGGRRSTLSVA